MLNAARFVMANPSRRKAKLAHGEHGYARGNGFLSPQAEREKAELLRKERESRHAENAARHQAAQIAEAERRKLERQVARQQAMNPSAGGAHGAAHSTSAATLTGPDAPLVYRGVEPSWLRARHDYRHEFLPHSQAFLAINSMEKPLAVRSAAEKANIDAYLRTLPYLADFYSQPQLQSELVALCRLQPAKKGEVLYKAGELQTKMYILVCGVCASHHTTPAGSELVLVLVLLLLVDGSNLCLDRHGDGQRARSGREVICCRLALSPAFRNASAAVAAGGLRHLGFFEVVTVRPRGDPTTAGGMLEHTSAQTTVDICQQQSIYNTEKQHVFEYGGYNSPEQNLLGVHFFCPWL